MKLFNNPTFSKVVNSEGQQDGTFLHDDIVLKEIIRTSCSPYVYQNNREFLEVFSQTLVNFAPVSINLMDYWNKNELYSVCVPIDPKSLDKIDKRKHVPKPTKGFFLNSILPLQEKLSEVYMNNFFTVAFNARNSHVLRSNLADIFKRHGLNINSTDNKKLLFNNVNALFYEPRFLTNKEYNTKKGKPITFYYASKSAWEAEIEGEMTSDAFFCDYKETGTLDYEVTSVLLGDVYRSFVKPLTHPLGFGERYSKVCKIDLSEKVLGKLISTADAVTVRWSNPSDKSPTPPPYMLLDQEPNPDYDPTIPVGEPLDPNVPGVLNPEPLRYIYPYPSAIPNKEHIVENNNIPDPNHPNNTLLNRVYATWDGFNLDPMISEIDNAQGNILQDIETGYGVKEYSGYEYTKYIFKNGSYLIEYSCLQENARFKRLVEYYRYDSFDISIHLNLMNADPILSYLYPSRGVTSNIINGRFNHLDNTPGVLTKFNGYGFEDENIASHWPYNRHTNLGLDRGLWTPLPQNYPTAQSSYIKITERSSMPDNVAPVAIQAFEPLIQREEFSLSTNPLHLSLVIDPGNHFIHNEESIAVYVNGLRKFYNTDPGLNEYTLNGTELTINGLSSTDQVQVIQELPQTRITRVEIDQDKYDNTYINYLNPGVNLNVFRDGELFDKNNYKPDGDNLNKLLFTYEAMHDLAPGLGVWEQRKVEIGDIFYVVEYPGEVKTSNHRARVEDLPEHYIPIVYPGLTEQNSIHFNIDNPYRDVAVWTNGKLINRNNYDTIRIANEWSAPRTPIDWDQNTNIVNTKFRFIPVYTLISRFIEKRSPIVNTFNLQRHDSPSIVEEFKIKCIPYNRSVINTEFDINDDIIDTKNIVNQDESVQNRYQIHIG